MVGEIVRHDFVLFVFEAARHEDPVDAPSTVSSLHLLTARLPGSQTEALRHACR